MEIQCLLNFHYDVGRQGIEIFPCIKFCLSQCQLHPHTYAIKNVLVEIVFCGFPRNTVSMQKFRFVVHTDYQL